MKFFLVFLGLFAIATAAPLAIRRVEHAALAPSAGVVGGRDIIKEQHNNSNVTVGRSEDHSIKPKTRKNVGKRQFQVAAEIFEAVVDFVEGIIDEINEDNTKRDQFTINTVSQSSDQWPAYNWVICDSEHTTAFDGAETVDWGHSHHELDLNFGSAGYELYWFKSGTFTRIGDGGYLNWAYEGIVTGTENNGAIVHFASP